MVTPTRRLGAGVLKQPPRRTDKCSTW